MKNLNIVNRMYKIIDKKDTQAMVEMMTDDAVFTFGNSPSVHGKKDISNFLENFYNSIKALKHDQLESWQKDDKITISGRVTYTRLDNNTLEIPFAVVLKMKGEFIHNYNIFADTSELYN